MVYHNFKVISFKNNLYSYKYNISNKWSNIKEYSSLLNKNWKELKFPHYEKYLKLMNKFYVKGDYYSKNFYLQALQDHMKKLKIIKKNSRNIEKTIKVFSKHKNKKKILKNLNIEVQTM